MPLAALSGEQRRSGRESLIKAGDLREELVANDRQVVTILEPAVPVQEFNVATSSHDVKREGTGYVVGQYYP